MIELIINNHLHLTLVSILTVIVLLINLLMPLIKLNKIKKSLKRLSELNQFERNIRERYKLLLKLDCKQRAVV